MLKNYFKLAFRNLIGNKFYSIINIFGLFIGFVCAIFILLYIEDELSYDKHHEKHKRIYRMESAVKKPSGLEQYALTAMPLGVRLKEEYPEIVEAVRFFRMRNAHLGYQEKQFYEQEIYYTDASVFDVFTHKFLKGSSDNALRDPDSIVITESLAQKYFGNENPIGKTVSTKGFDRKVTGVIEDLPGNSHLKFSGLVSMESLREDIGERSFKWLSGFRITIMFTYVLVNENSTISSVIDNLGRFYDKYFPVTEEHYEIVATPLTDLHLRSGFPYDLPTGNIMYVYTFGTVAILLLLIGSINYMNIATAYSAKRAKEVGLRKVMGAVKGDLIIQFLVESVVISFLALVLSIIIAELLLPVFNLFANKELTFLSSENVGLLALIFSISVIVGLSSGSYPAFYLSRFMPARILKDSIKAGRKSGLFRKILVVVQFSISIIMIIGTLVVIEQLNYMKNKDLGFDKEEVLVLPLARGGSHEKWKNAFKEELLRSPLITKVASSYYMPGISYGYGSFIVEQDGQMEEAEANWEFVDYDYLGLMGIEVMEGRNFDRTMSTDEREGFIINEAAAKSFGWGNRPIGKRMQMFGADNTVIRDGRVIGVVKDFSFQSLHNDVEPLAISLNAQPQFSLINQSFMSIRLEPGRSDEALSLVKDKWKEFSVDAPIDYYFLDEKLEQDYRQEEKLGTLFAFFSVVCIFLCCLGLLGLSSYVIAQRTKEIGIRKVLGASVPDILFLVSKDFLVLVIIANVVAWPIAGHMVNRWLEDFAFRIDIGISAFIMSGLAAFLIALTTVSFQSYRAASADPIKSIRYE